jgi:acetolactate synthase-1/2/3 large subunit
MPQTPNTRSGGQVLADALYAHGVELAYCVAGESYLELLDALYDYRDRIRLVTCRQEGGAANMAEAYGKLTGKPGVVMVTRGPGACHAAIGCHTAFQDSTPMVMLVGQVARDQMDREAFQEIDYRRMFGQVAKWVAQIETADRIPEYLARAFHTATSGRPGPVVLALPEDMLRDHVAVADAARYQTVRANPGPADLETLRGMLAEAERPLMLVGGGGWSDAAAADIVATFRPCARSAASTSLTTTTRTSAATSAPDPIRRSSRRSSPPTCWWSSARGWVRSPPRATP